MLRFAAEIDKVQTCAEVLDGLHRVTFPVLKVCVLGAGLMPLRWGDWNTLEKGKTVFLHKSAPDGWYEDWRELNQTHPGPGLSLARLSLAPFTTTEMMQHLEPLGIDRLPIELSMKYGMRDTLTCPVGGRWIVVYWSGTTLTPRLSDEAKAILFMGATFAAIRLQKLVGPDVSRLPKHAGLTPRELSVLRLLSTGHQLSNVAQLLGLGKETIRSHVKKAQTKLGVRNRTHAVVQALRLHLIP